MSKSKKPPVDLDAIVGVHEAAELLGMTRKGVQKAIERGQLFAKRLQCGYILRRDEVLAYHPRDVGRPRGK